MHLHYGGKSVNPRANGRNIVDNNNNLLFRAQKSLQ